MCQTVSICTEEMFFTEEERTWALCDSDWRARLLPLDGASEVCRCVLEWSESKLSLVISGIRV